jgi:hypothetical protein
MPLVTKKAASEGTKDPETIFSSALRPEDIGSILEEYHRVLTQLNPNNPLPASVVSYENARSLMLQKDRTLRQEIDLDTYWQLADIAVRAVAYCKLK